MELLNKLSLIIIIIGSLNWFSIGLFEFDIVAFIFGGQTMILSRLIYSLVGLAGIWAISLLFKDTNEISKNKTY